MPTKLPYPSLANLGTDSVSTTATEARPPRFGIPQRDDLEFELLVKPLPDR